MNALTRRSLLAGLLAAPFVRLLGRFFPAAPVVANTRRAIYMGAKAQKVVYGSTLTATDIYYYHGPVVADPGQLEAAGFVEAVPG